jgi:hypothetical protein
MPIMPDNSDFLQGTWRLKLFQQESKQRIHYPFGRNAPGLLIYSAEGWMSVQIGRDPMPAQPPTPAMNYGDPAYVSEAKTASPLKLGEIFDSYLAYYGLYTIDLASSTVYHHVSGSNRPSLIGQSMPRRFARDGSFLTLTPPVSEQSAASLLWEKVE